VKHVDQETSPGAVQGFQSWARSSRGWARGGKLPWAPRRLGGHCRSSIKSPPEYTILKRKIHKSFALRGAARMFGGPTRMFPRAPLWLSTSLELGSKWCDLLRTLPFHPTICTNLMGRRLGGPGPWILATRHHP